MNCDPEISECGNTLWGNAPASAHEYIVCMKGTQGTEPSKYLEEKKINQWFPK